MDVFEFMERIINDGIAAVKVDYSELKDKEKLDGSISGFEKCRGKNPTELLLLLRNAQKATHDMGLKQGKSYWFVRCEELEIEWVCNCMSVVLLYEGLAPLVNPTARGAMKAAYILGAEN